MAWPKSSSNFETVIQIRPHLFQPNQTKKSCSNFSSEGLWKLIPESKPTSSLLANVNSLKTSKTLLCTKKSILVHFKIYMTGDSRLSLKHLIVQKGEQQYQCNSARN